MIRLDCSLNTEGDSLVDCWSGCVSFVVSSAFSNRSCRANPGKNVTCEITSAQKTKSRESLATTFSLILFLALC